MRVWCTGAATHSLQTLRHTLEAGSSHGCRWVWVCQEEGDGLGEQQANADRGCLSVCMEQSGEVVCVQQQRLMWLCRCTCLGRAGGKPTGYTGVVCDNMFLDHVVHESLLLCCRHIPGMAMLSAIAVQHHCCVPTAVVFQLESKRAHVSEWMES